MEMKYLSWPAPSALILVAVIPAPRDFEIARTLGWYRIPLRTAPKLVAVDYLAFYQPATFADRRWRIEFVAEVLGHELVRRMDLLHDEIDHPHAQEDYFRMQLGPLEQLPRAIHAGKWKRITFLYTTGDYLRQARMIKDLVIASDERRVLWHSMRERLVHNQGYPSHAPPGLPIDAEALAKILGIPWKK
jgi:hypothetical protein